MKDQQSEDNQDRSKIHELALEQLSLPGRKERMNLMNLRLAFQRADKDMRGTLSEQQVSTFEDHFACFYICLPPLQSDIQLAYF